MRDFYRERRDRLIPTGSPGIYRMNASVRPDIDGIGTTREHPGIEREAKPFIIQTTLMATDIKSPPLLTIGIDAGDPVFIEEWADQGHLPNIASIMKNGFWGRTSGPELITEHGVWISLLSGISRGRHGYHYFRQLKPGTYELEPVTGMDIDAIPFWAHLIGKNKKSLIIDAADTRLYEGLPGIQVSNWATHHNWDPYHFATVSEPPDVMNDIRSMFGPKLTMRENHTSTYEQDLEIYGKLLQHVKIKGKMCRYLADRDKFDVSLMVFAESHSASHQFWKYHPKNRGNNDKDCELTHAIREVYKAIDAEIGLIIEQYDNPNVCIVSSVGMEDDFPNAGLAEEYYGIFFSTD